MRRILTRPRPHAGPRTRSVLLATGVLVVVTSPFAVAKSGDFLREGARNGTTTVETEIIGSQKARTGKGGYVTRQSNISTGAGAGGGAIYGCRAPAGGTASGSAPCLRASNLSGGSAFEFATSAGVAGLFTVGDPALPNPGKPFVTNATGVATGLNADQVDGKSAADFLGKTEKAVDSDKLDGQTRPQIVAEARTKAGLDADTVDGVDSTTLSQAEESASLTNVNLPLVGTALSSETIEGATGSFVMAMGHVTLDNQSAAVVAVNCFLRRSDGTIIARSSARLAPNNAGGEEANIAMTAVDALAETTLYQVFCDPTTGADDDVRANSSGLVLMPLQSAQDDTTP